MCRPRVWRGFGYLDDGENIYLQRGNDTKGFYRYSIKDNAWYVHEDLPAVADSGSSLEYVGPENSVYETPGNLENLMYRYCLDNSAYSDAKYTTAKQRYDVDKSWRKIEIDASIPSGADENVIVQVSDNFDKYGVQDSVKVSPSDGIDNYSISGLDNWKSRVRIKTEMAKGTSDFGPVVHSYRLFGENSPPQISTNFSENVDAYSVDLVGELLDNASANDNVKFQYRESGAATWENADSRRRMLSKIILTT